MSAHTAAIPKIRTIVITTKLRDLLKGFLPLLPSLRPSDSAFFVYNFSEKKRFYHLYILIESGKHCISSGKICTGNTLKIGKVIALEFLQRAPPGEVELTTFEQGIWGRG
ncbi:hypothetical protein J2741_001567 [Methanolinea mesophila]|uniref:hypothetical protein n=1 Tax=Methanolinea mesophila TaxID=547055 RepID=UPI001AE44958|nr:hypothetical protein [Methanolinea mesophila]MBP1929020.1 hypothetical protein [Methanolinea mesophila]